MKPLKDPLGVSPSKGYQGTTRGKEKILLTFVVGIEPTTSGLDLPLLSRSMENVSQSESPSSFRIFAHLIGYPALRHFPLTDIPDNINFELKGHSQLWDRVELDTSFLTLKRVHLNLKSKYI